MNKFDVIVVGAGHAGIEAALASARMGRNTACVTLRIDRIGHLPCNCSIGGPAKGHIAREVDALGGQMGIATDHTLTHIRRVGTGKGPAVQTVRAHVCKNDYPLFMQEVLSNQPNLTLIEAIAETVLSENGKVTGLRIKLVGSEEFIDVECRSIVLTTGTFLNGLCHMGAEKTVAARHGDQAVFGLSAFLKDIGVNLRRFKTGTTPRVKFSSLNVEGLEVMESEPEAGALSFLHGKPKPKRTLFGCHQTRTNQATHDFLQSRLHESAMFSGQIEGVGPRYCPSIEDKIVRFADKDSHPIFLEIEDWDGESVYVQGFSTSLPAETQLAALRTIPGMEKVEIIRYGYAVEYDMADPLQLYPTLMSKLVDGLYLAGQLNGTSGYEEAAGQGIVAGINAARFAVEEEPVIFDRGNSFIGVMIDDLVTKGVEDPYRMLTARAEHRLLLRHDNADQRLTPISKEIGLCSDERWTRFNIKQESIEKGLEALQTTYFTTNRHQELIEERGHSPITNRASLFELMKRPGFTLLEAETMAELAGLEVVPVGLSDHPDLNREVREQVELAAKYDGYLQQQQRVADQSQRLESLKIPAAFDYQSLKGLSFETIDKLSRVKPLTIGQASRVPGVRPSDIALLIGFLRGRSGKKQEPVSA
ncbi:MAG: tRNA uridine-5-carboxymethylaminomethyl(34) synthesis enzyme MnmG [Fimbriimonadaceae bacterium]|nr:tRNA uridine-5-carboxymethylaminomethyl(34) synthesis enzyme MnmG [Fimbriimonadaceae bacterium]